MEKLKGLFSPKKIIKLHWMRHAISCDQMLEIIELVDYKFFKSKNTLKDREKKDPLLSNYGINKTNIINYNNKLISELFGNDKLKIILTSNLKRAVETAIYSFGYLDNVIIIPVPFIGQRQPIYQTEINNNWEPSLTFQLKDYINKLISNIKEKQGSNFKLDSNSIKWTILEEFNINKDDPEVNSEKFDKLIIPKIFSLKELSSDKESINNIIVVSHSDFIKERSKKSSLNNLEILTEIIKIDINKKIVEKTWDKEKLNEQSITEPNIISDEENYKRCEFNQNIKEWANRRFKKYPLKVLKEDEPGFFGPKGERLDKPSILGGMPIKMGGFLQLFG